MITTKITLKLEPWKQFVAKMGNDCVPETVVKQWASRYSAYARKHFLTNDWQPLSDFTIARRKKNSSIPLRDTGTLMNALSIGANGNVAEKITNGLEFGIRGGEHPSGKTIGEIAYYHNEGIGNNPKREIIIEPDQALQDKMTNDWARWFKKVK